MFSFECKSSKEYGGESKKDTPVPMPNTEVKLPISEKLEIINLQLAQRKTARRKLLHWLLISVCVVIVAIFAVLGIINSPYLGWNYSDPETAVLGVGFHAFEWLFGRLAPIVFIGTVVGVFLTRKKV